MSYIKTKNVFGKHKKNNADSCQYQIFKQEGNDGTNITHLIIYTLNDKEQVIL
jgi:hypothetical protein